MSQVIEQLRLEPALAWKLAVNILGHDPNSIEAHQAVKTVHSAPLVQTLLSERNADSPLPPRSTLHATQSPPERDADGKIPFHPYKKWNGAHWVLSILADLGYPAGDPSLKPLVEQSFNWLLGEAHKKHIRTIDGRVRRCASQESNAVWYSLRLGLADERTLELAERLMKWQWPDGGWNCDKQPEVTISSFMESLIPLRALALYAKDSGDPRASQSAERAAGIFLKRQLFKRLRDGQVMDEHFVRLHYPCYWHYDILFGLQVMAEAGFIGDTRCKEALDLIESKRLPDGGFPAEETYSRTTRPSLSGYSLVDWGGASKIRMNPFVTADALYVLRLAGRLSTHEVLS